MNDTANKVEARIRFMMQRKSASERFIMGCSMYETAKTFVESSLKEQYPNISPKQLKYMLLTRFYMEEFKPEQFKKIKEYLCK